MKSKFFKDSIAKDDKNDTNTTLCEGNSLRWQFGDMKVK